MSLTRLTIQILEGVKVCGSYICLRCFFFRMVQSFRVLTVEISITVYNFKGLEVKVSYLVSKV